MNLQFRPLCGQRFRECFSIRLSTFYPKFASNIEIERVNSAGWLDNEKMCNIVFVCIRNEYFRGGAIGQARQR